MQPKKNVPPVSQNPGSAADISSMPSSITYSHCSHAPMQAKEQPQEQIFPPPALQQDSPDDYSDDERTMKFIDT